jgi:hypothetical protein
MTLEGWIKPDNLSSGDQVIITKYDANFADGVSWYLSANTIGQLRFIVYSGVTTERSVETGAGVLTSGVWQHVAASFDLATQVMKTYVNGVEVTNTLTPWSVTVMAILDSPTPVRIGAAVASGSFSGLAGFWDGSIDEISLYNRPLTASEIQAIYSAGSAGKCQTLNQPPTAGAGGPYSVPEGGSVVLSGSGSDPDGDPLTYAWDLDNNGSFETPGQNPTFSAAGRDGPGSQTVRLQVCDNQGACSTPSPATVTITNVPPVITGTSGPVAPLALGTAAAVSASFTDAGTPDTHTCTVAWDDGTTSSGTVAESGGSGTCSASRAYTAAGVYTVTITVRDDDTGTATATLQNHIVVYDPGAGFVTGGGWINSPAGALVGTTLTGRANFGFVSRYRPGAAAPVGQTEFQLHFAAFNFHSSAYDWLVVAGHRAQYRGSGTVNGVPGYSFRLTAYDGHRLPPAAPGYGQDRFRIKVWQTGSGTVVYDNRLGASDDLEQADPQVIGGGSIVIHTGGPGGLRAAGDPTSGAGQTMPLTGDQVRPLWAEALVRWRAAGATPEQLSLLRHVAVRVEELPAGYLGLAAPGVIWLSATAAGRGWFLDATPWVDEEFGNPPGGPAHDRIDLLSVLAHEQGHLLGWEHSHGDADVMDEALPAGVRRVPVVPAVGEGPAGHRHAQSSLSELLAAVRDGTFGDALAAEWPAAPGDSGRPAHRNGTHDGARLSDHSFLEASDAVTAVFADRAARAGGGGQDWFFANLSGGITDPVAGEGGEPVEELG